MVAGVSVEAGRKAVALVGERPLRVLSSAAPDHGADPTGMIVATGRGAAARFPEPATPRGRIVTRAVRVARERHR
jgi:hypothetical protein